MHGFFHAVFPDEALAYRVAGVVDTTGHDGPSVVFALLHDVQLVAAARAVLVFPEAAGRWVERHALLVAHTVGPDLRKNPGLTEERIAGRRSAVIRDVDDLVDAIVHSLGDIP